MFDFKSVEILKNFFENNDNSCIGSCLGITDVSQNCPNDKRWSFAMYIGNNSLLFLYERKSGVNSSSFDQLMSIDNLTQSNLKTFEWCSKNIRNLEQLVNQEMEFARYKVNLGNCEFGATDAESSEVDYNIFDISSNAKMATKELIEILKSNMEQIHELDDGDAVKFERGSYSHHAILTNSARMVMTHKVSTENMYHLKYTKGKIYEDFLIQVALSSKLFKCNHLYDETHKPKSKEEILEEARRRIGDEPYNLFADNCQHFVSSVRNGVKVSPEIDEKIENLENHAVSGYIVLKDAVTIYKKMTVVIKENESEKKVT